MPPGYVLHSLDSPSSQQHNAYTFLRAPGIAPFLGGNPQKKRGGRTWNV